MRPRRQNPFKALARALRSLLLFLVVAGALGWLGLQGWTYWKTQYFFPMGTTIGGINVAGMDRDQAMAAVQKAYDRPVIAVYGENSIEIDPLDAGFVMDVEGMVDEALVQMRQTPHWKKYLARVLQQPLPGEAIAVRLKASHDPEAVRVIVNLLAEMLDRPATPPTLSTTEGQVNFGVDGVLLNREQAHEAIGQALYLPRNRVATLDLIPAEAPDLDFSYLETFLRQQLDAFNGVGSLYLLDLQTGEEIKINADAAVSGLSVVKIAIMLETLRAVDGILSFDQAKLMEETAIYSGNFSANLLLDVVAGQDNAYLGSDILTESLHRLGLENTFIVTPYDEPDRAGKRTLVTRSNSNPATSLDPDPAMQTTAEEIGQLLGMIYDCSRGGGALIALYPEQLTPAECQYLIDLLTQNVEGNLIRFGVPEGVPVAHKHGWAYNTHGDAGIIFSPNRDYVLVEFLYADTDWMPISLSFPLLRELSRAVYNFYNPEAPYYDHKRAQRAAGAFAARIAAETAAAAAADGP